MDLNELRQRLHDPDQWVRVEALRILAMVEEARALRDIEWVFKNDPEPGVRQVAQWAGRIVYAAFQQSKRATASWLPPPPMSDSEDALLASLVDKDHRTYNQMQEQLLQHELVSVMQSEPPALPPPPKASSETADILDLLDAGLSDAFFEP